MVLKCTHIYTSLSLSQISIGGHHGDHWEGEVRIGCFSSWSQSWANWCWYLGKVDPGVKMKKMPHLPHILLILFRSNLSWAPPPSPSSWATKKPYVVVGGWHGVNGTSNICLRGRVHMPQFGDRSHLWASPLGGLNIASFMLFCRLPSTTPWGVAK